MCSTQSSVIFCNMNMLCPHRKKNWVWFFFSVLYSSSYQLHLIL
uniref:Uncharacterized protein n=1 Tax=Rhizophora mucronata TaxID=61149 RepID=A0A2P2J4B6_RHIMU